MRVIQTYCAFILTLLSMGLTVTGCESVGPEAQDPDYQQRLRQDTEKAAEAAREERKQEEQAKAAQSKGDEGARK